MGETILIVKRRGRKTEVKITKKMRGVYKPQNFTRIVNLDNYKDVALFLHDLNDIWSVPIDKAIAQYKEEKDTGWPF